jgi:hypothetical protein
MIINPLRTLMMTPRREAPPKNETTIPRTPITGSLTEELKGPTEEVRSARSWARPSHEPASLHVIHDGKSFIVVVVVLFVSNLFNINLIGRTMSYCGPPITC